MMQLNYQHIGVPTLLTILLLMLGCSETKTPQKEEKFAVTDSLLNRLNVDTVQNPDGKMELIFSAKITENQERKSAIFPMVSGHLKQINARLGDRVAKGQILATMTSAEMAGFDKDATSAIAEKQQAERSLKQMQSLFENGLASAKELEEARNDLQVKDAELKRANSVLSLNGGSKVGSYTIKSPISGFVIEKNANVNMLVRSDYENSLFTVADLSTVWAMLNVYESDIANLKEGNQVAVSVLAYPDRIFHGRIDKLYNLIDQESKVMSARVSISNQDFALKPGMLASVKVSASTNNHLPMVNAKAIIFDDNKNYVLIIDPNKKVRIQEIEIARKTAEKAYIKKGLIAGDRVISSKQVLLFESLKK